MSNSNNSGPHEHDASRETLPNQGQHHLQENYEQEAGRVTDFSFHAVARTKDELEAMEKAIRSKRWKEQPIRQFTAEVVVPSTIVGGLSLVFASYAGPVEWWQPLVTAVATWPTIKLAGLFGKAIGKPLGHYQNYKYKQSFMHSWVPGQLSAWLRGAAVITLLHAGHSLPIYGAMARDVSTAVYSGGAKTASCLWNGFSKCFNTSAVPADTQVTMADRAENIARLAVQADVIARQKRTFTI